MELCTFTTNSASCCSVTHDDERSKETGVIIILKYVVNKISINQSRYRHVVFSQWSATVFNPKRSLTGLFALREAQNSQNTCTCTCSCIKENNTTNRCRTYQLAAAPWAWTPTTCILAASGLDCMVRSSSWWMCWRWRRPQSANYQEFVQQRSITQICLSIVKKRILKGCKNRHCCWL